MAEPHILFRLGRQAFAIPLAEVKDVAKSPVLTPVPQADPMVRGLTVMHHQLATALDLRARFGLPLAAHSQFTALAVDHEGERVALLVDKVEDVLSIETLAPIAPTRDPLWQGAIAGVTSRHGEHVVVLDVAGMLESSGGIGG